MLELNIIIFVLGLLFGSFLNVCAYRLPRNKSIVLGRSRCPHCGHVIPFYQNVPLLSFVILKGKCHYCAAKISWQYPLVELLTGILTVALFLRFGFSYLFFFYLVFVYFLIVIALIDWKTRLIPNKLLFALFVIGLIINVLGRVIPFKEAFIGAFLGGGAMYVTAVLGNHIFKKEAMGMGDVKLAFVSGFFLGWHFILWALYLGFVAALLGIGLLWIIRRRNLPEHIPMGPFFALGFVLNLFYGAELLNFYFKLFS